MRTRLLSWAAGCLLAGGTSAGCDLNNPTYFPPPMGPIEVGTKAEGGGQATAAVALPFRRPTATEASALDARSKDLGFKAPWLTRDDVALSIGYTITNLSDKPGTAQVLVNGANEFTNYDLGALMAAAEMQAVNEDDVVLLSLIQATPVTVAPGQSLQGTIREDDFTEAELDLDAIGRWMAPPAAVLINRSEVNAIGLEKVPAGVIVPSLFSVSVTFKASQHMRLDFLVRVRDEKNYLLEGEGAAFSPKPAAYAPPAAMMMN